MITGNNACVLIKTLKMSLTPKGWYRFSLRSAMG